MVPATINQLRQAIRFSPPYGDGTNKYDHKKQGGMFSSPYGDGTKTVQVPEYLGGFSPPYGDGTTKEDPRE